jgi:hypothetical protein
MDAVPPSNNKSIVEPASIPKTVIFFDSKREAHKAHKELVRFVMQDKNHHYYREQALHVTQVFT